MKILLAENLKKLRKDKNLTQEELANFLDKSRIKKNSWNSETVLEKFTKLGNHKWLAEVRDNEKYNQIVGRIKSYTCGTK